MSKKKADKLAHERETFIHGDAERNIVGCEANGIDPEAANELFDQMMDFAKYAFNKSHAAAYAFNAYLTAWLKCYYPTEFFCAALNWAADTEAISGLMYEASTCGIQVIAPNVNLSEKDFTTSDGKILFSLSSIAGVKDNADVIIKEREKRPFVDFKDFYIRVRPKANVLDHLISAGALDCFGTNRKASKVMVESMTGIVKKIREKEDFVRTSEFLLPQIESFTSDDTLLKAQADAGYKPVIKKCTTAQALEKRIETAHNTLAILRGELEAIQYDDTIAEDKNVKMAEEKSYLGMYVTNHPMDYYPTAEEIGVNVISDAEAGETVVYGVISNLQIKNRKSDGAEMAFFQLEDRSGSIDIACFTKSYQRFKEFIAEGKVVKIHGKCDVETKIIGNEDDEERKEYVTKKVFVETIENVSETLSTYILTVPAYAVFHIENEETLRKEYEEKGAHPFVIYDSVMGEMLEMNYKVSDALLNSGLQVKELA